MVRRRRHITDEMWPVIQDLWPELVNKRGAEKLAPERRNRHSPHDFDIPSDLFETNPAADRFQYFHDIRLVRALTLQAGPSHRGHCWQLGNRLHRICMAVPANRWGSAVYTTAQLKIMQEVITLLVFAGFSLFYLKEPMTWNYVIGFALIGAGAFFVFRGPL
jgi:hypothetical protein